MWESLETIQQSLPWILDGALISAGTVICAMLIGLILGVPLAVGQVYGKPVTRSIIGIYIWIFRGIPTLVLLYLFYFGLSYQLSSLEFSVFGKEISFQFDISPFAASCLVLGLISAAYQSQIFRGAINSLASGQLKAAQALGMKDSTGILSVVLPQALRVSIPSWSNEYSIVLKDSALVSVLGTTELMFRTKAIATSTSDYTLFYVMAAVLYFMITFIGVRCLRFLEKKYRIPGSMQG